VNHFESITHMYARNTCQQDQKASNMATVSKCFFPVDHQNEESIARVVKDDGGTTLTAALCGGRLLSGAYVDRKHGKDRQRAPGVMVQALRFGGSVDRQLPPRLTVVVIVKQDLLIGVVREILLAT